MNFLEVLNTVASVGTLLVIGATAVVALGQLRHSRGSNQIVALTECRERLESDAFVAAMRFVRRELAPKLDDAAFRARLLVSPLDAELAQINLVGNFFEAMGAFVKHGIIDARIGCDLWSGVVLSNWEALRPVLAIMRRDAGPTLWENFEYLASLSEDFFKQNVDGTYPRGTRHMSLVDVYREADEAAGVYPRK